MKRNLMILALALAAPFAASAADGLSYSYVEGGYVRADADDFDHEDGWGVRGSAALGENFHIFAGWDTIDFNSIDVDQQRIGLGYNMELNNKVDLVARVSYERVDVEHFDDGNGYGAEVGVRAAFSPHFEGGAGLRYTKIEHDADTSLVLNAQYKFNPTWGIVAEAQWNNDANAVFVGPRISF